jgi:hypothetical protein
MPTIQGLLVSAASGKWRSTVTVVLEVCLLLLLCGGCDLLQARGTFVDLQLAGSSELTAELESLQITVDQIELYQSDTKEWRALLPPPLTGGPPVYDLLELLDGTTTPLFRSLLEPGLYSQLRLKLTLQEARVEGQSVPLRIQEDKEGWISVRLHKDFDLSAGQERAVILVCGSKHGLRYRKGEYELEPRILFVPNGDSGSISGTVRPAGISAQLFAIDKSDTLGAAGPDTTTGAYVIAHLYQGSYDLHVVAPGFQPVIETGIAVFAGGNAGFHDFNLLTDDLSLFADFEEDSDGDAPSGWKVQGTGPSGQEIYVDGEQSLSGSQSLLLIDDNTQHAGGPTARHDFPETAGRLMLRFGIMVADTLSQLTLQLEGKNVPTGFGSGLGFYPGAKFGFSPTDVLAELVPMTWYIFEVVFDLPQDIMNVYFQDQSEPLVFERALGANREELKTIFMTATASRGWVDRIEIRRLP